VRVGGSGSVRAEMRPVHVFEVAHFVFGKRFVEDHAGFFRFDDIHRGIDDAALNTVLGESHGFHQR